MAITDTSRSCRSCGALLGNAEEAPACARCGAIAAPHVSTWPPKLKRWLVLMKLRHAFAPLWRNTTHQRWEWLLRSVMAGRWWGSGRERVLVKQGASPADCYVVAVREMERWIAEGESADLDNVQQSAR